MAGAAGPNFQLWSGTKGGGDLVSSHSCCTPEVGGGGQRVDFGYEVCSLRQLWTDLVAAPVTLLWWAEDLKYWCQHLFSQ